MFSARALFVLSAFVVACGGVGDQARPWGGGAGEGDGGDGTDSTGGAVDEGTDGGTGGHGEADGRPDDAGGVTSAGGDDRGSGSDGGADDGGTGNGSADGGGDDGGPPPADCPAHCYCEPIDPGADIGDLKQAYAGDAEGTMIAVLQRRWTAGHDLLLELGDDPYFGSFTDASSFTGVMDGLMTEVHEGTHGWDWDHAFGQPYFGYWLRADLIFEPPKIDGFPRSEIYSMVEGSGTALYDGTYLTGTQGTYGFYELLDELNAYINGMGAIGVVGEEIPWGISGRDGALAFLYYLELYLGRARTTYPDLYAQMKAEPEYVELIKVQWLRTHFLLQEAADLHPHLGIHDDEIAPYLYDAANQGEIEMFIDHALEASNCLP